MHPWHDVALGDRAPEIVPVVIEVPKGSKNKKTAAARAPPSGDVRRCIRGVIRRSHAGIEDSRFPIQEEGVSAEF